MFFTIRRCETLSGPERSSQTACSLNIHSSGFAETSHSCSHHRHKNVSHKIWSHARLIDWMTFPCYVCSWSTEKLQPKTSFCMKLTLINGWAAEPDSNYWSWWFRHRFRVTRFGNKDKTSLKSFQDGLRLGGNLVKHNNLPRATAPGQSGVSWLQVGQIFCSVSTTNDASFV